MASRTPTASGLKLAELPDGTRIRLAPGSHSSPQEGVCVVELASVIAKEEFSDEPKCVCPVIGAFLRGWNDRASHAARQRLTPYATRIVDSRGSRRVTRERRDICLEWAGADLSHGGLRGSLSRVGMRVRIAVFCGLGAALRLTEGAPDYAARLAVARGEPESSFELLEALLAVGGEGHVQPPGVPAAGNGHAPMNGNGQVSVNGDGLPPVVGNEGSPAERHGSTNGDGAPESEATTTTGSAERA